MSSFEYRRVPPILVVEDSAADYETVMRVFKKIGLKNPVFHCETGDQALDFLYRRNGFGGNKQVPRPGIILLDLNLPGTDGRDVLKEVKADPTLKSIPIVILTTSSSEGDINECYLSGANSYMTKAPDWDMCISMLGNFRAWWLETASLPDPATVPI